MCPRCCITWAHLGRTPRVASNRIAFVELSVQPVLWTVRIELEPYEGEITFKTLEEEESGALSESGYLRIKSEGVSKAFTVTERDVMVRYLGQSQGMLTNQRTISGMTENGVIPIPITFKQLTSAVIGEQEYTRNGSVVTYFNIELTDTAAYVDYRLIVQPEVQYPLEDGHGFEGLPTTAVVQQNGAQRGSILSGRIIDDWQRPVAQRKIVRAHSKLRR